MSIFTSEKYNGIFQYSFQLKGKRYYGSTRTRDRAEALKIEANVRADAMALATEQYRYVYKKIRVKPGCERCGDREKDTHRHHWAPREFFADADSWPTSYLCKTCHKLWHDTINALRRPAPVVEAKPPRPRKRILTPRITIKSDDTGSNCAAGISQEDFT